MLESINSSQLEYTKLTPEEMEKRGILGRLVGVCADFMDPTRNGRKYGESLWEKVFSDPIMKERIENKVCYGELCHPLDGREETDIQKAAVCLAEVPKKGKDGKLRAVFDILSTPAGKILKALCDYGSNLGVSSRGSGDLFTDYDGQESVDPDSYSCEGFDIVTIPAVKAARLQYVTESLNTKMSLKESLEKLVESAENENDKRIMQETIDNLNLDEGLKGQTLEVIYNDADGNEKTTHFLCDKDYQLGSTQLETAIYSSDNDIKEIVKINESLLEDDNNSGLFSALYFKDNKYNTKAVKASTKEMAREKFKSDNPDAELVSVRQEQTESLEESEEPEMVDGKEIYFDNNGLARFKATGKLVPNYDNDAKKMWRDEWQSISKNNHSDLTNKELKFNGQIKEGDNTSHKKGDNHKEVQRKSKVADNVGTDVIEELQETLNSNKKLETQIIDLQEKLSVCYAKEAQYEEKISKLNEAVNNLTKRATKVRPLEQKVSSLTEQLSDTTTELKNNKATVKKLQESRNELRKDKMTFVENLNNKESEIDTLKENVAKLNESITKLQQDNDKKKTQYSEKLAKANNLVEQYRKVANKAINRYIDFQATRVGVTSEEIKNRLPESYGFDDIDTICESLESYQLEMSRLPISNVSLPGAKMSIKKPIKESLIKTPQDDWDEVDENLINLMQRFS